MDFSQAQIIGALLILVGAVIGIHSVRTSRKVQAAQMWPSVTGLVTSSEVELSRGKNRTYRAKIRYTYRVAGYEFTGRRCALGGELNTSNRGRAEARCAKYPAGSAPQVYYDPANPKDACLERTQEGRGVTLIVAGAFAAAGVALLSGFLPGG
jgi:hypothetical protein